METVNGQAQNYLKAVGVRVGFPRGGETLHRELEEAERAVLPPVKDGGRSHGTSGCVCRRVSRRKVCQSVLVGPCVALVGALAVQNSRRCRGEHRGASATDKGIRCRQEAPTG